MSTALVPTGEECPLCKDYYTVASISPCDHKICFKCAVRLRVICNVSECPQCRKTCDQVIITRFPGTFMSLIRSIGLQKKGFLYTENDLLRDVEDLLANKCKFCTAGLVFGTFEDLQKHCNKEHRLLFCDFCYENLRLFPSERKAYTSAALVEHRRNGDADDSSYRPHPPCQFCNNQRFFDDDALYRHLKSEHFSCHLCYASNVFYSDYFELRRHFQTKHYLCEEGTCREARFTNAFSNELDLKAHRAAYHANLMSKEELRENAKLDMAVFSRLNLTNSPSIARRQLSDQREGSEANRAGERGERISKYERRLREIQREREVLHSDASDSDSNVRGPERVRLTPTEFPALGRMASPLTAPAASTVATSDAGPSTAGVMKPAAEGETKSAAERIALVTRTHNVGKIPVQTEEDFPALCSSAGPSMRGHSTAWNASAAITKKAAPKGTSAAAAKKPSSAKQRVSSSAVSTEQTQPIGANTLPPPPKKEHPHPERAVSAAAKTSETEQEASSTSQKKNRKKGNKAAASSPAPDADFPPLSSNLSPHPVFQAAEPKKEKKKERVKPVELVPKSEVVSPPSPPTTTTTTTLSDNKNKAANKKTPVSDQEFPPLSSKTDEVADEENRYYAKLNKGEQLKPTMTSPPPGFAAVAKLSDSIQETTSSQPPVIPAAKLPAKSSPQPVIPQVVEKPDIHSAQDFPDLPVAPPPKPVVRKAPPPGFTIIMPSAREEEHESKEVPKPPPPPAVPALPNFPFWRAADYDKRNLSLQSAIEKNLNARSSEEFRTYSKRFREGILPAFDFLSKCVDIFPRKQLGFILSELIVLLPDVRKQHALLDALSADSLLSTLIPHLLSSCPVCSQITTSRDASLHRQSHNAMPLSANGLPTGDVDSSGLSNIDLSNYVLSGAT